MKTRRKAAKSTSKIEKYEASESTSTVASIWHWPLVWYSKGPFAGVEKYGPPTMIRMYVASSTHSSGTDWPTTLSIQPAMLWVAGEATAEAVAITYDCWDGHVPGDAWNPWFINMLPNSYRKATNTRKLHGGCRKARQSCRKTREKPERTETRA